MKHIRLFLFLMIGFALNAQDLTGKWITVDTQKTGYYEEMYLIATNYGEGYYGHAYDTQANGYCRYWLKGSFDGLRFNAIENELIHKSQNHRPTVMNLIYETVDGKEYLVGNTKTYENHPIFGMQISPLPNIVRYKKVSDEYKVYSPEVEEGAIELHNHKEHGLEAPIEDELPAIINQQEELERLQREKQEQEKRLEEEQRLAKEAAEKERLQREKEAEEKRIEEERIAREAEEKIAKEEKELNDKKEERTDRVVGNIEVNGEQEITIEIWDYGKEDNDIVTIFANDEIIAKKIVISREVQKFTVKLDPSVRTYKLLFLANNLGEIPPNSAQIKINFGGKARRYKLFTDEENNAVISIANQP